jgi:hypothetical protein
MTSLERVLENANNRGQGSGELTSLDRSSRRDKASAAVTSPGFARELYWSGRRGSNPRHSAWEAAVVCALGEPERGCLPKGADRRGQNGTKGGRSAVRELAIVSAFVRG